MCWMCDQDARTTLTRYAMESLGAEGALARLHFALAAKATDGLMLTGHDLVPPQAPALIIVPDNVPGDTSTTATLTVGAPSIISTINTIGDQDFYQVTLEAGQTYEFGMYAFNGGPNLVPLTDAYVEIYDGAGNLIVSGDGGASTLLNNLNSGFDVLLTFTPEAAGTFYVNARAYDQDPTNGTTGDFVGDYELFVREAAPGGYTPYYDVDSPLYSIDWGTQVDGTSRNPDGAEGPRPTGNEFTGHAWNPFGIEGKNVITYYFARQGEIFIDEDPTTPGTTDTIVASGFEDWEKDVYLNAFGAYSKVADIVYVEVQDRTDADFVLITYEGTPGPGVSLLGRMSPPDEENEGRTEFNANDQRWTEEGLAPGGFSFTTLIHELGHGHGLAHPHDNGGRSGIMRGVEPEGVAFDYTRGDFDLNQSVYTMMSYEDGWQTSPYGQPSTNDPYGWLGSLMAFDVAAIQDKYGVNEEWATGNDTYVLNDVNAPGTFYSCIWDADGTDSIVYSGARNANIDLRAASLLYEFGGGGWISYAFGIHGGFTIANGVTIENAYGGSANDTLTGNDAANLLDGGGGADIMAGGKGNDVYRVDNALDVVTEAAGEGSDSVYAAISFALAAAAEVEVLGTTNGDGTGAIDLTGSDSANSLYGNAGANVLNGAGGADFLVGLGGNDLLIGGAGADVMRGGAGNDAYRVEDALDAVFEGVGEGDDAVYAGLSYTLTAGAAVETLGTTNAAGTAAIDLTGNDYGQSIYGNAGANRLHGDGGADHLVGLEGNDVLIGGGGSDALRGGAGNDEFRFDTNLNAGNIDSILDYSVADDVIGLDDAVFAGLALGTLSAAAFRVGSAAGDADDRIIYNSATGALFFDADGNGAGAAVQFATLQAGLALTSSEFTVI